MVFLFRTLSVKPYGNRMKYYQIMIPIYNSVFYLIFRNFFFKKKKKEVKKTRKKFLLKLLI